MKQESRVLGVDDAPFDKFKNKSTKIIGVVYRGGNYMDGVVSGKISVDGEDSTKAIIRMVKNSKFFNDIRCLMLKGLGVGGLNIVDIDEIYVKTKIPVLVVMRHKPDKAKLAKTLEELGMGKKALLVHKAGKISKIDSLFVQSKGLTRAQAKELLKITITNSSIPEPLRVAHLIAGGIVHGESRGKA